MKNIIGLKELRENVASYAAEVQKGRSFDEGSWETVVDFTEFYKDGIPARTLLKKLRALHGKSK